VGQKPAERAAHRQLNEQRAARGLRPVRRGNVRASPQPRREVAPAGYAEYIQSGAWQQVRRRFCASRLPKDCYCCARDDGPKDLHHRTYKNLGHENLRDLVPLCRDCHNRVHELARRRPSLSLWGATGAVRRERHPVYGRAARKARREARGELPARAA
jgi:5-methylcytosine-specific restriction endonuclease McrA